MFKHGLNKFFMKSIQKIIVINFSLLVIWFLIFQNNIQTLSFIYYLFPVIILSIINGVLSIIYYKKGIKNKAQSFLLAGVLILIIGGSSCVSIKIEPKKPKVKESRDTINEKSVTIVYPYK